MQLVNPDWEIKIEGKMNQKVVADKNRLNQVLINLISNGIKYSTKIKKIEIKLSENNKSALIGIQDYGLGIPRRYRKKIFDKFFQIEKKKMGDGFGLGLYICHEIVKKHNGKIWVESKLNNGSTFYVSLPTIK
jgi:signal transduction histidine kinase